MGPWDVDQVLALAPDPASAKSAQGQARTTKWPETGCSERAVWGLCQGSGKQPYQTTIDLSGPAFKCSCPSRKFPCKHALGLLLLWSTGEVRPGDEPEWATVLAGSSVRGRRSLNGRNASRVRSPTRWRPSSARRVGPIGCLPAWLSWQSWLDDQVRRGLGGFDQRGTAS